MLIKKLDIELAKAAKTADEVWVAVGLLNSNGLNQILNNLKNDCIQNFLIGIDLPTEPKALRTLLQTGANVKIYDKEYFHPKMYLFRMGTSFVAFVGSANCTTGGLSNNVELSFSISDKINCQELQNWFDKLFASSEIVTTAFLDDYQAKYAERLKRKKEDALLATKAKKRLKEEAEIILIDRKEFIKMLKGYRERKSYVTEKDNKSISVKQIRQSLDYENNFKNIDLEHFFSIWDLGHLIPIYKPAIKREIKTFTAMLRMLCNEKLDISFRYDKAFSGDLSLKGVGENIISKVLAVHRPDTYFVKNGKSESTLQQYGLVLPRGLSKGDKYKATCHYLRQACKEAKIDDLTILDYYLYLEAGGENG